MTPYLAQSLANVALVQHSPWDVSDGGLCLIPSYPSMAHHTRSDIFTIIVALFFSTCGIIYLISEVTHSFEGFPDLINIFILIYHQSYYYRHVVIGAEETQYGLRCLDYFLHSPSGLPITPDLVLFNWGVCAVVFVL
jgi:hypothetical protein